MVAAILAVEDESFYQHKGVNLRSLMRATLSNFASEDRGRAAARSPSRS